MIYSSDIIICYFQTASFPSKLSINRKGQTKSIPWSRMDATLSVMQRYRHLSAPRHKPCVIFVDFFIICMCYRSVIPLTDTDSDNKTSVEELAAFTQKTLKKVHDEEAKFRLEILDKNKDNKVSWEEYLQSKENIGGKIKRSVFHKPFPSKTLITLR